MTVVKLCNSPHFKLPLLSKLIRQHCVSSDWAIIGTRTSSGRCGMLAGSGMVSDCIVGVTWWNDKGVKRWYFSSVSGCKFRMKEMKGF